MVAGDWRTCIAPGGERPPPFRRLLLAKKKAPPPPVDPCCCGGDWRCCLLLDPVDWDWDWSWRSLWLGGVAREERPRPRFVGEELRKWVLFVLLAILLECAVTKGVAGADADVGETGADVGEGVDELDAELADDDAPFFNRMDLVADAVVILMLFLTLLCEYVIVISSLSDLFSQSLLLLKFLLFCLFCFWLFR